MMLLLLLVVVLGLAESKRVAQLPPCQASPKIARHSHAPHIYNRYWKGEKKASNLRYIAGKKQKKGSIVVGVKIWDGLVSLPSGGGLDSGLSRRLWKHDFGAPGPLGL